MREFTTGETTGATKIPVKTIQRYIRDYPEGFSAEARKPTKGRRYNAQDVKNLLTIRQLLQAREDPQRIRAALAGEWMPESMAMIDLESALQIAQVSNQAMLTTKAHAEKVRLDRSMIESKMDWTAKRIREIEKVLAEQAQEITQLRTMLAIRKPGRITPEEQAPAALDKVITPKKNFLDRLVDRTVK